MSVRQPRYSMEEHARRGDEIYERVVRPRVEQGDKGKVVAIDIETEEFELAGDPITATHRLLERLPNAQIWRVRIGFPGVHRFGSHQRARDYDHGSDQVNKRRP